MSGITWIGRPSAEHAPLVVSDVPTSAASASSASGASSAPETNAGTSPEMAAMRREEVVRARFFARWIFIMCVFGLVVHLLNHAETAMRIPMRVAILALGGSAAWLWRGASRTDDYAKIQLRIRVFGVAAVVTSVIFHLRIGVFSPVTAIVVFCLAFFARSESKRAIWLLSSIMVAGYVAFALLVSFDVVADPGMFAARYLTTSVRLFATFTVAGMYLATVVQARSSRASAAEMLKRVKEATLEAHRREAQLEEARQELDRALRAAAGRHGRYTGTMVGSYIIEAVVGRGAIGEVYAARDPRTGARVAAKMLSPKHDNDDPRPRFYREARIAASLRSPHLVEVYAIGEAHDGTPFIAMELLQGRDLATHLRDTQRMSIGDVVELVDHVARGISVAHAAGVVHRDIKPQNLFQAVDPSGRLKWKVLDFGISTLATSNGTLTAEGIVGTPGYMAPEQANGERVDARTDIFALGAVAYRALTGQRAFSGTTTPEILYNVVFTSPIRPRDLVPSLPRDVEAVIAIALAKDPSRRFSSASEMANALRRAATNDLTADERARAEEIHSRGPWKNLRDCPPVSSRR